MENKNLPEVYSRLRNNRIFGNYPSFSWPPMLEKVLGSADYHAITDIDIQDHDDELVLSLNMEGFDSRDLDVTVRGNTVIIKGDNRQEEIQDRPGYYFGMQTCNSFYHTIPLPAWVKSEKTTARYHDGNLEIKMLS